MEISFCVDIYSLIVSIAFSTFLGARMSQEHHRQLLHEIIFRPIVTKLGAQPQRVVPDSMTIRFSVRVTSCPVIRLESSLELPKY